MTPLYAAHRAFALARVHLSIDGEARRPRRQKLDYHNARITARIAGA